MQLEIFDVEHGACALITTSNGKRIMIDCGDNTTTGWQPGTMLRARGIGYLDELIVTNYDEDHVSGFRNLKASAFINVLRRNMAVSAGQIRFLKTEDGMGLGIDALVRAIEHDFTGGPPAQTHNDFGDTQIAVFRNMPGIPPFGFDDENNLSLVAFVACGSHTIIFPGDLEKAGWAALLPDPGFRFNLSKVTLFVASHHGRESGYCEEVLKLCPNIQAVVISDKKMGFQSQETVPQYRRFAKGFIYANETRRVLTTRRDGTIRFTIPDGGGMAQVLLGAIAA
jgi:beta-lactamase superfamily II metal-dependent hydrolase